MLVALPISSTAAQAFEQLVVEGKGSAGGCLGADFDQPLPAYCRDARPSALPLPHTLPLADYERPLYAFLKQRGYRALGWCVDKAVRDTGPFIEGRNYGTHPAVRVYYSPEVMRWLLGDRRAEIPDGAMIVKEMFDPPAARHLERRAGFDAQFPGQPAQAERAYQAELDQQLSAWTTMVKDRRGSKDGWFWANPAPNSAPDTYGPPFSFPASGAGLGTCMRCHASAAQQLSFSSLQNILGFEPLGDPLRFRVDDSWRSALPTSLRPSTAADLLARLDPHRPEAARAAATKAAATPATAATAATSATAATAATSAAAATATPSATSATAAPSATTTSAPPAADTLFLATFPLPAVGTVQPLPGPWADRVVAAGEGAGHFLSSDNCMGCHGGLSGPPYPLTMFVKTGSADGAGFNVSPYGEWRWSPMGLAGRDPIFFAQLESELALLAADARKGVVAPAELRTLQQAVVNTCMSCHGAMGQRQLATDWRAGRPGITDPDFHYPAYTGLTEPLTAADFRAQQATQVDGRAGAHSMHPYRRYGPLAREGISCAVCHRVQPPSQWTAAMDGNQKTASFLLHSTTGVFPTSPPDILYGPFADVLGKPMQQSLGITPKQNPYIQDSRLCGTCHTINLPNLGIKTPPGQRWSGLDPADREVLMQAARNGAAAPNAVPLADKLTALPHSIEQATYLEWENSDFAWNPGRQQSCQDCHMPRGLKNADAKIDLPGITTQIATIQDASYPQAEHALSDAETRRPSMRSPTPRPACRCAATTGATNWSASTPSCCRCSASSASCSASTAATA